MDLLLLLLVLREKAGVRVISSVINRPKFEITLTRKCRNQRKTEKGEQKENRRNERYNPTKITAFQPFENLAHSR